LSGKNINVDQGGKKIQCFTLVAQIIEIHAHEFPRSTHNIFQHHNGRAVVFHLENLKKKKKVNKYSISLWKRPKIGKNNNT